MLKAAIIGCGNIAGFLDSPSDESVLTHAHAYQKHTDTDLTCICDPSAEQRERFVQRWGQEIRHYHSVHEMLANEQIDILSICSPTTFHFEGMLEALKDKHIQTIICEKPFVQVREEFDALEPLLNRSNKRVIINFMRRYDPSINRLHELIQAGSLGNPRLFIGKFTKGLYHNGSHMLELIEHLCGEIKSLSSEEPLLKDDDIYGSFSLKTASCSGILHNFSGDNFALFELEILFSKGRVLIKDSGHTIQIETVQASKEYEGYFSLQSQDTLEDTLRMNLYHTVDFAIQSQTDCLKTHLLLSKKLLDIKEKLPAQHTLNWDIHE